MRMLVCVCVKHNVNIIAICIIMFIGLVLYTKKNGNKHRKMKYVYHPKNAIFTIV